MFHLNRIRNASNDSKNMWEVINNVTGHYKCNNVHINTNNSIVGADG